MAVKFEFTLSDIDASNLLDVIHTAKAKALQDAQKFLAPEMTRVDRANYDWYIGHAEYLEGLKQKVLVGNKSVDRVESVDV